MTVVLDHVGLHDSVGGAAMPFMLSQVRRIVPRADLLVVEMTRNCIQVYCVRLRLRIM